MTSPILLDARWFHHGGVGRVTRTALKGFRQTQPPGEWLIWGPPEVEPSLWPGASLLLASREPPLRTAGYSSSTRVPRVGSAVFLHFVRPFTRTPNATIVHDTIPVRFSATRPARVAWRAYLTAIARSSAIVFVDSERARELLAIDTGLPRDRIRVLQIPVDQDFVNRVRESRRPEGAASYGVYVGQAGRHKNLQRLLVGFSQTRFRQQGGRLRFVGVESSVDLLPSSDRSVLQSVDVFGKVSETELIEHLSGAAFLALVSLEEGFGLPAVEAASAGIPIVVSNREPLVANSGGLFPTCDPLDPASIAAAIDSVLEFDAPRLKRAFARFHAAHAGIDAATLAEQLQCAALSLIPHGS